MLTFNEKLKEIRIWEILIVYVISTLACIIVNIEEVWAFLIVVIYILFRTRHYTESLTNDLKNVYSKIPFKTVLLIFVTNLVFAIGVGYLTDYLVGIYPWLEYLPSTGEDMLPALTMAYLLSFVETVLLAPISEELIFRGVLLSRLNRKLPLIISIIISSVIFGLLHGFSGLISAFIFGVCMCVIYLKTDNIFTSMTVHILNNLSVMILMFIPNIDKILDGDIFTVIFSILGVISIIWILNFLRVSWGEIKE